MTTQYKCCRSLSWPAADRSETEPDGSRKPHAHSDYIGHSGLMDLHGMEEKVDVMIEAKAKELCLLQYRQQALDAAAAAAAGPAADVRDASGSTMA